MAAKSCNSFAVHGVLAAAVFVGPVIIVTRPGPHLDELKYLADNHLTTIPAVPVKNGQVPQDENRFDHRVSNSIGARAMRGGQTLAPTRLLRGIAFCGGAPRVVLLADGLHPLGGCARHSLVRMGHARPAPLVIRVVDFLR
jgi:hypothetical protein